MNAAVEPLRGETRAQLGQLGARLAGVSVLLLGARALAQLHYLRRLATGRVNSDIYLEDFAQEWELLPFEVVAGFGWTHAVPLILSVTLLLYGVLRGGVSWSMAALGALLYFWWAAELALFLG